MDATLVQAPETKRPLAAGLLRESWRYLLASAIALGVDYGLLIALTEFFGIYYLVSAAISFCAGLVVSYGLSVRFVFATRSVQDHRAEFVIFCVIGLLGLAVNEGVMKLFVDAVGIGYVAAKIPAAGFSFLFNFVVRRVFLFSEQRTASLS